MTDATRTREEFNAIKEVCQTFGIEKFHECKYLETHSLPTMHKHMANYRDVKLHEATIDNNGNHVDL